MSSKTCYNSSEEKTNPTRRKKPLEKTNKTKLIQNARTKRSEPCTQRKKDTRAESGGLIPIKKCQDRKKVCRQIVASKQNCPQTRKRSEKSSKAENKSQDMKKIAKAGKTVKKDVKNITKAVKKDVKMITKTGKTKKLDEKKITKTGKAKKPDMKKTTKTGKTKKQEVKKITKTGKANVSNDKCTAYFSVEMPEKDLHSICRNFSDKIILNLPGIKQTRIKDMQCKLAGYETKKRKILKILSKSGEKISRTADTILKMKKIIEKPKEKSKIMKREKSPVKLPSIEPRKNPQNPITEDTIKNNSADLVSENENKSKEFFGNFFSPFSILTRASTYQAVNASADQSSPYLSSVEKVKPSPTMSPDSPLPTFRCQPFIPFSDDAQIKDFTAAPEYQETLSFQQYPLATFLNNTHPMGNNNRTLAKNQPPVVQQVSPSQQLASTAFSSTMAASNKLIASEYASSPKEYKILPFSNKMHLNGFRESATNNLAPAFEQVKSSNLEKVLKETIDAVIENKQNVPSFVNLSSNKFTEKNNPENLKDKMNSSASRVQHDNCNAENSDYNKDKFKFSTPIYNFYFIPSDFETKASPDISNISEVPMDNYEISNSPPSLNYHSNNSYIACCRLPEPLGSPNIVADFIKDNRTYTPTYESDISENSSLAFSEDRSSSKSNDSIITVNSSSESASSQRSVPNFISMNNCAYTPTYESDISENNSLASSEDRSSSKSNESIITVNSSESASSQRSSGDSCLVTSSSTDDEYEENEQHSSSFEWDRSRPAASNNYFCEEYSANAGREDLEQAHSGSSLESNLSSAASISLKDVEPRDGDHKRSYKRATPRRKTEIKPFENGSLYWLKQGRFTRKSDCEQKKTIPTRNLRNINYNNNSLWMKHLMSSRSHERGRSENKGASRSGDISKSENYHLQEPSSIQQNCIKTSKKIIATPKIEAAEFSNKMQLEQLSTNQILEQIGLNVLLHARPPPKSTYLEKVLTMLGI